MRIILDPNIDRAGRNGRWQRVGKDDLVQIFPETKPGCGQKPKNVCDVQGLSEEGGEQPGGLGGGSTQTKVNFAVAPRSEPVPNYETSVASTPTTRNVHV